MNNGHSGIVVMYCDVIRTYCDEALRMLRVALLQRDQRTNLECSPPESPHTPSHSFWLQIAT